MRICADPSFRGWIIATAIQNVLLQIFGAIVNILSLWCLWKCKRTGRAIKLQLSLVFSLLLLISVIILPGEGWINHMSFYCNESSDSATIFFLLSSGFTLQLERMNISSVAIYRFIAVKFPQLYKRITKVSVVLILEAFICGYIGIPYLLGFTQTVDVVRFHNGNQYVKFGEKNTTIYTVIYKLYAYNFLIPFLITLVSYSLMVATVLYQKYKSSSMKKSDHVTLTLQFLILVDLLLDGPHAICHFIKAKRTTMSLFHMIFHMHLLADPLIFLLLNPHNRRRVIELLRGTLPTRFAAYLPPPTASSSLQGLPSPTPQQSRKFQVNRQESNKSLSSTRSNSQKFKHVYSASPPETKTKEATENSGLLLPLNSHKIPENDLHEHGDGMTTIPLTPVDDPRKQFPQ